MRFLIRTHNTHLLVVAIPLVDLFLSPQAGPKLVASTLGPCSCCQQATQAKTRDFSVPIHPVEERCPSGWLTNAFKGSLQRGGKVNIKRRGAEDWLENNEPRRQRALEEYFIVHSSSQVFGIDTNDCIQKKWAALKRYSEVWASSFSLRDWEKKLLYLFNWLKCESKV